MDYVRPVEAQETHIDKKRKKNDTRAVFGKFESLFAVTKLYKFNTFGNKFVKGFLTILVKKNNFMATSMFPPKFRETKFQAKF